MALDADLPPSEFQPRSSYGHRPYNVEEVEDAVSHDYFVYEGTRLHFLRCGDPANKSLVLLHGLAGTWLTWYQLILPLSKEFHVVCLDLPGHGRSEPLPSEESLAAD